MSRLPLFLDGQLTDGSEVISLTHQQAGRSRDQSSSPGRVKNFLFSTSSITALGSTQPPIQCVPGALSPGIKRPGHEADHSPPTSAEVKKNVNLYIHSPIRLHGLVLK
jgi:hypothetical protein